MLAVGMAVDYNLAANERSEMQNALDAAAFAALMLPDTATKADRQTTLQQVYETNGGDGAATIDGDLFTDTTGAALKVRSSHEVPTIFMAIAGTESIKVSAKSSVKKPVKLKTTRFKLSKVTGAWDKIVTLMGRPVGAVAYQPLLRMTYVLTSLSGGSVTTMSKLDAQGKWIDFYKTTCTKSSSCTNKVLSGDGTAEVDVSGMDDIYMQMDISAKVGAVYWSFKEKIRYLYSNDPNTSDQMFVAGKQTPKGTKVDMMAAVGCTGKWIEQRWEDGGGWDGAVNPWEGTDFRYEVIGGCSTDGSSVRLTN